MIITDVSKGVVGVLGNVQGGDTFVLQVTENLKHNLRIYYFNRSAF